MKQPAERERIWADVAIVLAISLACGWVSARLELVEHLFAATRRWERFQIDDLAVVLVALALGLAWFAARRYAEARREVAHRLVAEGRLSDSLAEQRRLAQRTVTLQEEERKALARELHDELGQYLNAIKLDAVAIRNASPGQAEQHAAAQAIVVNVDHVYRTVGNLIRRLRPVGLDELGLAAALEHLVDGARQRAPSTRFSLTIEGDVERLGEACDLALYRAIQEGLTNCTRHAAASAVQIELVRAREGSRDEVRLTITDDGAGANWAEPRRELGLVGMRERLESLGGRLHVTTAPGYGFRLVASVPIAAGHA